MVLLKLLAIVKFVAKVIWIIISLTEMNFLNDHDDILFSLELATSDITKAVNCAQSVWNANGFKVWKGWEKKCKDIKNLPSLNECFSRSDAIAG